jgi:hypothetical protein
MSVRELAAAAVIATSALSLTACEQEVSGKDMDAYVEDTAKAETMAEVAKEDTDLKDNLAKLQAKDPSVKDAYYAVNDKGEKELHVVTENPQDPEKVENSVWPIVGAMAGGAVLGHMLSSGGASNYVQQYPPRTSSYYSREDEKKNRNTYSSVYTSSIMANRRAAIYKATPPGSPALKQAVLSTKTTGIYAGAKGVQGTGGVKGAGGSGGAKAGGGGGGGKGGGGGGS